MESNITLNVTLDEMKELFEDCKGGFSIRYYERTKSVGDDSTFNVVVRHGDNIGYQDGKTFDYQSFMKKFDDPKLRARLSEGEEKTAFSLHDMEIAKQGLEGGLSVKVVAQVLKVYGSSSCKKDKYVKDLLKSEKIQKFIKQKKTIEQTLDFGR